MNIINAIYNLVKNPVVNVVSYYSGRNRANNAGDALEEYIKDLFANTFDMSETARLEKINEVFSYLGNNSNPPDAMLRGGDAIETKKIESNGASLALNSSYPKHNLKSNSPMISSACRSAEDWTEKDMIYAVGIMNGNQLKHLAMVYGLDYCASEECYSRIKKTIKSGVEAIPGVEFAETKELGHINKVDPLGITYMRVRGMWGIENPWRVFEYVYKRDFTKSFNFMCIINETKWNTFDNTDLITSLNDHGFEIRDVRIKNPDNPARLVNAKLIMFSLD
ncbi:MAG: NgoPII family restriction endonuclease [Clostridia bacterium]|nr:NgoPII family restriction endonuclease [Clostridia bacterium]